MDDGEITMTKNRLTQDMRQPVLPGGLFVAMLDPLFIDPPVEGQAATCRR
jgi:hypothetical protein